MKNAKIIDEFNSKLEKSKPIIGIDYGAKKIGISISDSEKNFAMPYINLENDKVIYQKLSKLIEERKICGVVFGYPIEPSGKEGAACEKVIKFVQKAMNHIKGSPYFYQDERLSTKVAQALLRSTSLKRKKRDQVDDMLAASNILQTTLDLLKRLR